MDIDSLEEFSDAVLLIAEPVELSFPLLIARTAAEQMSLWANDGAVSGTRYFGEEPVATYEARAKGSDGHSRTKGARYTLKSRLIRKCGFFLRKVDGAYPLDVAHAFIDALGIACRDAASATWQGTPDPRFRTCLVAAGELATIAAMHGSHSAVGQRAIHLLLDLARDNFASATTGIEATSDTLVIGYGYWRALGDVMSHTDDARQTVWAHLHATVNQDAGIAPAFQSAMTLTKWRFARVFAEMAGALPSKEEIGIDRFTQRLIEARTAYVAEDPSALLDYPLAVTAAGMLIEWEDQAAWRAGLVLQRLTTRHEWGMRAGRLLRDRLMELNGSPFLSAFGGRFKENSRWLGIGFSFIPSALRPAPESAQSRGAEPNP